MLRLALLACLTAQPALGYVTTYFPNAASNRVAEAQQERQIRDAQSDLQMQPSETYTPRFPYDGPSSFDAAPQTGPTTYGYEDFAGGYTGGDLYGVVGQE